MNRFEAAFARWVIRQRWAIIVVSLLIVAIAGAGVGRLHFTNNYRVFFSPDNPQLRAFEALENTYVKNDNVMIVVAPADGDVFTRNNLALLEQVTAEAWQVPYSNRVDSITNFQHTEAADDELRVRDLVSGARDLGDDQLARVRRIALAEPLLRGNLVAADGRVAAVNVTVQLPRIDETTETPAVVAHVRALAAEIERTRPDVQVYLTGVVMMDNAFSEASVADLNTLVATSFVLMLLLVGILLGGISGTLGTGLVIGFAIAVAMGLGGYIGYPISAPTSAAPVIILTVAIANCVHILETFLHAMAGGQTKHEAIVESVRTNLYPIFLASVTTVIGFLTFNFSEVPPFRQLGNLVAFGDVASYFLAVTFLPALLAVLPAPAPRWNPIEVPALQALGEFVIRRRTALLWGLGILSVVLAANLPRNELNDVFLEYFDQTIEFRTDSDFTVAHLTGLYHMQYSLDSGEPGGINEPAFLRDVAAFAAWYRAQPEAMHVASITDVMQRLNMNMNGDDPAQYRLPESRELAAQYLLLYELSLPYGLDLNNQINVDKSSTRVGVSTRTLSSKDVIALNARAEAWLAANAPTVKSGIGTGTSLMFADIGKRNINSMLLGTVVALVLISFLLLFMLRSVKLGLVSLIPNLLPLAMGFGLWGIIDGQIGLSLSVVTSMTLGIIIDDTVHFLSKYQRARRMLGCDPADAVRYAFRSVGRAMLVTSIVLVTGFMVLTLSHFELNAGMGLLTAIVISLALLADLMFLSPFLLLIEEKSDADDAGDRLTRSPAVV